jgi:hypothetical protein
MADETYNFDDGTDQGWALSADTNGVCQIAAAAALNGSSYGLELGAEGADLSGDVEATKTLAITYADIYLRFRLKLNAACNFTFNGYGRLWQFCESSIYNPGGRILLDETGGAWTIYDEVGTNHVAISVDTEYDVEVRFVRDASNGGFQVWIDDSLEIDDLTHDTSGNDIGFLYGGFITSSGTLADGSRIYVDEIEIAGERIGGAAGGATIPVMLHHYAQMARN